MSKKNKNHSFEELSKLIISCIEEEQFFNKPVLIPKVRSILSGFKINLATTKYNKIESPSDAARRLRQLERKDLEKTFFKRKLLSLIGEDAMKQVYLERDEFLAESGFDVTTHH